MTRTVMITGASSGYGKATAQLFLDRGWRVVASMILAVLLAVPAGLVMGQSRGLNRLFSPLIYLTYPVPKVVLVPIVVLLFGVGGLSKIVVITLILFFQILVLVRDAAANLRPELLQSVRSLGAGRRALTSAPVEPADCSLDRRPPGACTRRGARNSPEAPHLLR